MKGETRKALPSVGSNVTAAIGIFAGMMALGILIAWPASDGVSGALFLVFCYLIPVGAYEVLVQKVHRNPSSGLVWGNPRDGDIVRVTLKLIAFAVTLGAIFLFHAVFRVYTPQRLEMPLDAALRIAPYAVPLIIFYFYQIDRRMKNPHDAYMELGQWLTGRNPTPDWAVLKDYAIGWIIKGFFLPVMFTYLALKLPWLHNNVSQLSETPVLIVAYLANFIVALELIIVVVGYAMTLRLFDAHIRSANGLLGAWVVTLICYEPLNRVVLGGAFRFRTGQSWRDVIYDFPSLMWIWLALIVLSYAVWIWATAIFGLRWSNLTNRGIITNGPYKYCKHPDYLAKSVFFWLTAAPFLTAVELWQGITASLGLMVANAVYYARARTEEKHLSEDPAYVEYALHMNRHSLFVPLARVFPFLIYHAPDGRTSMSQTPADDATGLPVK